MATCPKGRHLDQLDLAAVREQGSRPYCTNSKRREPVTIDIPDWFSEDRQFTFCTVSEKGCRHCDFRTANQMLSVTQPKFYWAVYSPDETALGALRPARDLCPLARLR